MMGTTTSTESSAAMTGDPDTFNDAPKFTKGPWAFKISQDGDKVHFQGGHWFKFARCYVRVDDAPSDEGMANAHLISAAPDMFTALQAVSDFYGWNGDGALGREAAMVRAALRKALGLADHQSDVSEPLSGVRK